jgi:hypothetical protein
MESIKYILVILGGAYFIVLSFRWIKWAGFIFSSEDIEPFEFLQFFEDYAVTTTAVGLIFCVVSYCLLLVHFPIITLVITTGASCWIIKNKRRKACSLKSISG